jgi:tRNA threonylcarbamoyladenosine biosynthesis protein TsaB
MLILAVDSSGKDGSLALVRFGTAMSHTIDVVSLDGGTFSAHLVPQIGDLLAKHNLSKENIDGFAAASGPGSFTGLRIGLAVIKALAEILHKPIAAVSLLEAVAIAGGTEGRVIAALAAGRNEIYAGFYEVEKRHARCVSQQLLTVEECLAAAEHSVVTPDPQLANIFRDGKLSVITVPQPRADVIARLGVEMIRAGEITSPESVDATYSRRSGADAKPSTPAH